MHIPFSYKFCNLYGPFSINFYGFFIALALIICIKLVSLNKRYAQLHLNEKFIDIIIVSIVSGIIGGRFLEIISSCAYYSHWTDWFALWEGGFSALGSILGVIIITPVYLKKNKLAVLPICDLVSIYAPLFQSIARFGCLFAGCCHGIPTTHILNIIYTNKESIAPYNIPLHPTQIYSSFFLFIIFLYMFFIAQHHVKYSGQLFLTYLLLASIERFIIDFWRADRIIVFNSFLSFHQIIALIIFVVVINMICIKNYYNINKSNLTRVRS